MLRARSVWARYDQSSAWALRGVDLELGAGVCGLLGPNGAGKSTLLRILASSQEPTRGEVTWNGAPLSGESGRHFRRSLGYLPQDFSFDAWMRVGDLLHYVYWLRELPRRGQQDEIERCLSLVGLADDSHVRIRALSGGMRRRVGIAQALLGAPAVVVLDEPTVGLDPRQRNSFRELLSNVARTSCVVLSTHMVEEVAALGGRVVLLSQGAVAFDGGLPELAHIGGGTTDSVGALERGVMATLDRADLDATTAGLA